MIRLFTRHRIRVHQELEGLWDFSTCSKEGEFPADYPFKLPVPGCWESHPALITYRGVGAYRTLLQVPVTGPARLLFEGVAHTAGIWLDGRRLGGHYNAYTPFHIDIPHLEAGEHELIVFADNSFSEASSLHIPNDYYSYGGIHRPVALEHPFSVYFERLEFIPRLEPDGQWMADVSVYLNALTRVEASLEVSLWLDGLPFAQLPLPSPPLGASVLRVRASFPQAQPWSPESPRLYRLEARLLMRDTQDSPVNAAPVDDLIERVGFREVRVQERNVLLNGQPVYFKGFNRHEDDPFAGSALGIQQMARDLAIMRDLGSNMVRTSHYPNDSRFLDLCDELGFLVWEENHARGLDLKQMENPNFERQCMDCNREMVENHINHPSIVLWGILNECASDTPEGREMYRKQFEQIRALDASRPLTFASNKSFRDLCLDLVDVVSFNLYYGWYNDHLPVDSFAELRNWVEINGGEGKPFFVSEFGASGDYGFRDPYRRAKWSEDRQADILESVFSAYTARPDVCGLLVWQFCDIRVHEEGGWFKARPKGKNDKGIVDEYRRPKLAYRVVKDWFARFGEGGSTR